MATLMRRMGLEALSRKPPRSRRHPAHTISPYLLRDLTINRPPPVWAADSPYLPMARGFVSLGAVLDWASRRVVAGRLATTLTTDFSLDAGQEAVVRDGTPEMFNADQGGQFTSQAFTGRLTHHGMQLSMDGNGWRRDTVFVERRWKSLKYEEVAWHAYDAVEAAHQGVARSLPFDNETRPHQALDGQTPTQMSDETRTTRRPAA